MPDQDNMLIAHRYQLKRPLGTGNMSTVYEAVDRRQANRIVAVKLLNTPHSDDFKQEFFRRETKALERLEHPNIVQVYDYDWSEEHKFYYIVLEYIPHTLLDIIRLHRKDTDLSWCWPLMRDITDALIEAHSQDIIHRDLKPSNILITESGTPKLTDFGISHLRYEINSGVTVSAFWSPGYASPEQRAGKKATEQSDIYSLGCVFYHMLARKSPPTDGITEENIQRLGVPASVKRTLRMMLEAEAINRQENAIQLRRQLEETRKYALLPDIYFLITETAQRDLVNLGMIKRSSSEAAKAFLNQEFGGDNPKEVALLLENTTVYLLLEDLRLTCVRDATRPLLVITAVHTLYLPSLERLRSQATSYRALWSVIDNSEIHTLSHGHIPKLGMALNELFAQLATHHRTLETTKIRKTERRDFMRLWKAALDFQQKQKDAVPRLKYTYAYRSDNIFTFDLAQPAPDDLIWSESTPIAMLVEGQKSPVFVGFLMSIQGKRVEVSWENAATKEYSNVNEGPIFPGYITLFQQESLAALERQRTALNTLQSGGSVNPRLPEVLQDLSTATFDVINEDIEFFQPDLAEDKKRAVLQALATRDVFLLQGPPGTGKTTTLAEIVLQILKAAPAARILITSQSNVAVNHILSRVAQLSQDQKLEIVRIGRAEKIGQGAQEWALPQRITVWREEVLARTEPILQELKEQMRLQQRLGKQQDSSTGIQDILLECQLMLEELGGDMEELAEYERMRSHFSTRFSMLAIKGGALLEDVRTNRDMYEELVREKTQSIQTIFELVRSYLPEKAQTPIKSDLAKERDRLFQIIANLLNPGGFVSREEQLLNLVKGWRKIFGKREDFAKPILGRANILAATCLISGGHYLKDQVFDWAIIDEAGRATAPELLIPLVRARRSIIVGDERQLPPMLDEELTTDVLTSLSMARESLEESLFSTLVAQAKEDQLPAVQMLTAQHRMAPGIGKMISEVFYDGRLTHAVTAQERYHGLDWIPRSVVWYSTTRLPSHNETRRGRSYYNRVEVQKIVDLLHEMERSYMALNQKRELAIITPYNAQIEELTEHVIPDGQYWQALSIEIATIDSFQGRDRDIVIYSTVRSNAERNLGFLRDRRRLNVGLSRAQQLLIIVGDIWTLEQGHGGLEGNPYLELIRYMVNHPQDCLIQDKEQEEAHA